jgi:DNA polymerase III sliding clamp (beta) subunit (PCNA family)
MCCCRARDKLTVTGTDLEVELVAATSVTVQQAGDVTVPGRKLLEIVRTLPEKANGHADARGRARRAARRVAAASRSRACRRASFR